MTTTTTPRPVPGSEPHADGGWGQNAAPFVPVQTRSQRPRSYTPSDFGKPTGREVNWKHTPLTQLAPLLDDAAGDEGAVSVSVTGPVAGAGLAIGTAPRGEVFVPEDLPAAIAWARAAEALYIAVPADAEYDEPILVEFTGGGADLLAHAHVVVEAGVNSRATVVLRHSGAARFAQNVEIIVRDGAKLDVVSVQGWDDTAVHAASHQARVERDAFLRHTVVTFGGGVVRVDPSVELAGAGAQGELYGVSFADAPQHLESQVFLHHKGPHTRGEVLYKSALQGVGARTVWIGDVLIGADAVGTDSYEANRNLVLTEGARADSIPNLEIETGDIAGAGHASATGRFDDEQLFYLQARGIPEDEARRLVVVGFLAEIVQKIGIPSLEAELFELIEAELAEGEGE
ncbi:Fe-S cluster assembly protein SufD [Microbacterium sp. LRZ72]|uniref:Fe-S cluster assembly protein SufD n=1 Tax=Microbacterium sp. LRZ72 TaxID=2942481 RepID=UPI0029A9EB63|nr:Fe-S cluster assembly protein SufD [Microbacterium sp. LRZ72]MDX2375274.1 Fe-S cluster assembly protein SufD [Microbacterium sp. LRZ72]